MTQSYLPSRWLITSPQFANDPDIFPLLPGFSFIVSKKPIWSTGIQQAQSGRERRRMQWSYPLWSFKVGYEVLRDAATYAELQKLYAFFNSHAGRFQEFFFYDPSDNQATNTQFGVGDGATRTFQLTRTVGSGALTFAEPVRGFAGAPTVYVNGVMVAQPIGRNLIQFSEQFGNGAAWQANAGSSLTSNTDVAPDSHTSADTLTDSSASGSVAAAYQNVAISNATQSYVASAHVKKTTSAPNSVMMSAALFGGTTTQGTLYLNTNTGAIAATGALVASGVVDVGTYWRIWIEMTNSDPGTTGIQVAFYPCWGPVSSLGTNDPTMTGSCVAWGAQVEMGAAMTPYLPTTGVSGDYTVGTLGQITFNSAPAAAAALTWTGQFLFLCRFDQDELDTQQMMNGLWSASGLSLIGVKS